MLSLLRRRGSRARCPTLTDTAASVLVRSTLWRWIELLVHLLSCHQEAKPSNALADRITRPHQYGVAHTTQSFEHGAASSRRQETTVLQSGASVTRGVSELAIAPASAGPDTSHMGTTNSHGTKGTPAAASRASAATPLTFPSKAPPRTHENPTAEGRGGREALVRVHPRFGIAAAQPGRRGRGDAPKREGTVGTRGGQLTARVDEHPGQRRAVARHDPAVGVGRHDRTPGAGQPASTKAVATTTAPRARPAEHGRRATISSRPHGSHDRLAPC